MQTKRSATDIAWAAGLFEGEGCWNAYGHEGGTVRMQVRLGMTDRDVVERFAAIVGVGNVSVHDTPAHRAKGWKPLYTWCVYEAEKVREVIALLLPYMGERRRAKAEEVLRLGADIRSHNSKKTHCPAGHELAGDNLIEEPIRRAGREYTARRCRTCRRFQERERKRRDLDITPDRYRI